MSKKQLIETDSRNKCSLCICLYKYQLYKNSTLASRKNALCEFVCVSISCTKTQLRRVAGKIGKTMIHVTRDEIAFSTHYQLD